MRRGKTPWRITLILVLLIALQLGWRHPKLAATPQLRALPTPPPRDIVAVASLGDPAFAAKLLMIWLQGFDRQGGQSLSFQTLDYRRLRQWLQLILDLDPTASYPLVAASRVYSEVADDTRRAEMLDFVSQAYRKDPARRWPWLAHAVFVARYKMGNKTLAFELADVLTAYADPGVVPAWARQLAIFTRAGMGEKDAARALLGALLASGEITDAAEHALLSRHWRQLSAPFTPP